MTDYWKHVIDSATKLRRELHRSPELTGRETITASVIRNALSQAGIPWRPCANTGTLAWLARDASGPSIALRADMDALPLTEESGVAWVSETQGCMHACGHDGHMATLMATALWLKDQEQDLPGPVTLIFQPAEEGGHGARHMIDDGALDGADAIYGWHNWPDMPLGQAVCPDGVVMAGNGTFRITVTGQGGHASQPELCRDPVIAASAIVLALQQIVSRRLPPQQAAVVGVTSFNAASTETIIPERVVMAGNIRLSEPGLRKTVNDLIVEIARDTARAWGVEARVEIFPRYDATVNAAAEAGRMRSAIQTELGEHWQNTSMALPVMASEDFHYYLKEIPGAYALIGAGGHAPLHNPRYDFNDALIAPVARILIGLAGGAMHR